MVENRKHSDVSEPSLFAKSGLGTKDWLFTLGFGGGSNCWWGQTPRFLPEDFKIRTKFGVGYDWPIEYRDLLPFYEEAEAIMEVSGPSLGPFGERRSYPQPPHRFSDFDEAMAGLVGDSYWVHAPSARSSSSTATRNKCCATGNCGICPIDAKFTVLNAFGDIYSDPRVTLVVGAKISRIDISAGVARKIFWLSDGRYHSASADLFKIGLNAIFNVVVLHNSGINSPLLGRRLHEQVSRKVEIDLSKIDNFNGGTHITGLGYMYASGDQRRNRASCIVEHYNSPPILRTDNGKWRRRAILKIVAENVPDDRNRVEVRGRPVLHYHGHSDYAIRALDQVQEELLLSIGDLGIDEVRIGDIEQSEGHIQGTTVMGSSEDVSVLDDRLLCHGVRNLVVGGSGCFPSGPPANPSLTIAALSLRSAALLA